MIVWAEDATGAPPGNLTVTVTPGEIVVIADALLDYMQKTSTTPQARNGALGILRELELADAIYWRLP